MAVDTSLGDLTKNEVQKVVFKLLNTKDVAIFFESSSGEGTNLMGNILRVKFKKSNDDTSSEPTSLILKFAPKNAIGRKMTGVRDMFLHEITMYEKVLSYFNEFQLSKGFDLGGIGFNEFPFCYSTLSAEMHEMIILEDLKLRHFEQTDLRKTELTFDHVSLIMKVMGKFHAISFALKDQQSAKFEEIKNQIVERYWSNSQPQFRNAFEYFTKNMIDCLRTSGRLDLFGKFEKIVGEDVLETVMKLTSGTSEPYAVICHGDLTTFNSMFRYDVRGKPIEVQIFDWQFSRFASPVTDLVPYVLCSTTKELRDKHFDEFMQIYYQSLSDLLRKLGSNPDEVFPYNEFLNQCRKYGAYAAFVAAFLMFMLHSDFKLLPSFENATGEVDMKGYDTAEFDSSSNIFDDFCHGRIVDLFDDLARFNYI